MNSQPKSKKSQNERDGSNAFSKFVSLIYKDESSTSETNVKSTTANIQTPYRPFPLNVLTNNPLRNTKTNSGPMSYANVSIPPRKTNRADENSYYRESPTFSCIAGIMQLSLRNGIRIDITVDNCIRLTSCAGKIVISLSSLGDVSAVKHPNGLVYKVDKFVQIIAHDQSNTNISMRYANMYSNGISFTSSKLCNVFVLDSIGTRQTKNIFLKLTSDNTSDVFFGKSKHGSVYDEEASQYIQKASFKKCHDDGMDVITINDFRIWQMKDGLVTVARMSFPFKIRASPMNCSFTLSTPDIHCTASSKDSPHLFVRCQDQSMHYDGINFVVRYNGNSAGFDKNDYLIVY